MDPNGSNRIDPAPGENFAVYCFPGGFVDIWDTSGKPFQFATTTFNDLKQLSVNSVVTGNVNIPKIVHSSENEQPGVVVTNADSTPLVPFTVGKDITGKFVTLTKGENSKTFSLNKCEAWVNYKADPKPNNPQGATYNAKTSAIIANNLDWAKIFLVLVQTTRDEKSIAEAKAGVARWERMYRSNDTIITENADGSTTFKFNDGYSVTVKEVKKPVCDEAARARALARLYAAHDALFRARDEAANAQARADAARAKADAAQKKADAAQARADPANAEAKSKRAEADHTSSLFPGAGITDIGGIFVRRDNAIAEAAEARAADLQAVANADANAARGAANAAAVARGPAADAQAKADEAKAAADAEQAVYDSLKKNCP